LLICGQIPKLELIRDTRGEPARPAALVVSKARRHFSILAAARRRENWSPKNPCATIRTTIHGTEVILDAAHRFGKPVLITQLVGSLWQGHAGFPSAKRTMC